MHAIRTFSLGCRFIIMSFKRNKVNIMKDKVNNMKDSCSDLTIGKFI